MKEIIPPSMFGDTTFCEDVRMEVGNKISLMGVFNKKLIVEQFPVALQKMVLAINYREAPNVENKPLSLWVFLPGDGEDVPSIVTPIPDNGREEAKKRVEPDHFVALTFQFIVSPLVLMQEGDLKVRIARGDDELVRIGAMRIELATPSPQPNSGAP